MLSLLLKRLSFLEQNSLFKPKFCFSLLSSFTQPQSQSPNFSSEYSSLSKNNNGFYLSSLQRLNFPSGILWSGPDSSTSCIRLYSRESQAAAEPSTSDGLTVEGILANTWAILDEDESDWKSHASAIAQSIHLIKKRVKV